MIKLLIVDNRYMIRFGIKAMLLSKNDECKFVFEEAFDAEDGLEKVRDEKFDIAIINFDHPKLTISELISLYLQAQPSLKILVLRNRYDYICYDILQKMGAKGCILKDITVDDLLRALKTVKNGGMYYPAMPPVHLMNDDAKSNLRFNILSMLSKRELEILKYIVEEYTNEEIGKKLFISKRTVDTHRQNLLHKLGVKNTAGLVKYALELKLIE
jgi:DNA-binding NarL/FixJ family response regulator